MAMLCCSGKSGDSNDDSEILGKGKRKNSSAALRDFFLAYKYWNFMLCYSCNANNSRINISRRNNICSEKYIWQSGFWLQYAKKGVNFTWLYHNAHIAF